MIDFNKIIELLDKEILTPDEKKALDDAINKDPEVKKLSRTYLMLKASLNRRGHIDEELMGEYVLYKNNLSQDKVTILLSRMIEDHIRSCGDCESLFKELNAEYSEVDEFIVRQTALQSTPVKETEQKKLSWYSRMSTVKYAFTSLAAVFIIYIALFTISSVITPDYKKTLMDEDEFYTTRGRTSELFQRGLDAIDRKNYDSAIEYLNNDLEKNKGEESIFYTHFVLGITYLHKAENDFIGLFKSFDIEDVQKGIASLEKSIALNNSGNFDNLKIDAHYFIGKSYLLIDDKEKAKEHLELVVEEKGSYYKRAEELLNEL